VITKTGDFSQENIEKLENNKEIDIKRQKKP